MADFYNTPDSAGLNCLVQPVNGQASGFRCLPNCQKWFFCHHAIKGKWRHAGAVPVLLPLLSRICMRENKVVKKI